MGDMKVNADVKEASIQAIVIRANGTARTSAVSYYHRNPLKRAMWALKQKLKEK
jgi:hypothetical protein